MSCPLALRRKNKYQTCLSNDLYFQMKLCKNGLYSSQMINTT